MKLKSLAVAALLFAPVPVASAQDSADRGVAGKKIYDWCMRLDTGSVAECGCVAGFYAGATADDEFQMVATFLDHINTEGAVIDQTEFQSAVLARKQSLGLSEERFDEIIKNFSTFDALGDKADAICIPVEQAAYPNGQ